LAHAVESLWSTRSTERSRALAEAALTLLVPILRDSGRVPDRAGRDDLSTAATLAGQAIDVTRTTAAHALSYPLTSHLGVPHGHACALHLIWLAPLVEQATDEEIVDGRGPGPVRSAVASLRRLLGAKRRGLGGTVHDLVAGSGLRTGLSIPPADAQHLVSLVVNEGLASNRMAGMPVKVDRERVAAAVADLLGAGPEGQSFGH
jgi:alcohol dehydrogenase